MKTYRWGERGVSFLNDLLRGGDELAHALQSEDLSQGDLFTFLPDGADPERVSLEEGGLNHLVWDDEFCQSIKALVRTHLKTPGAVFVVELDSTSREAAARLYNGKPYNVFLSKGSRRVLMNADGNPQHEIVGVYGYVTHADKTAANIQELISDRRAFWAVAALTSFHNSELPGREEEREAPIFTRLARNAQHILGTAFDDEGWIIWSRTNPEASTSTAF